MNTTSKTFIAACLLCTSIPSLADINEPPATPDIATVTVTGVKDRDTMPYSIVFKQMNEFNELKENDKIYLRFLLEIKKDVPIKFSDVVISVEGGDVKLPVKVEDDGTVDFPVSQAAFDAKAEILTNQSGGKLKIIYAPGIKVPAEKSFHYAELMDGVKQSTSMMRKFWHFFFPSFLGASLKYANAHGQSLTIQTKGGDKRLIVDASRKSIALPYDSTLYRENPILVISELPEKIVPYNVGPQTF